MVLGKGEATGRVFSRSLNDCLPCSLGLLPTPPRGPAGAITPINPCSTTKTALSFSLKISPALLFLQDRKRQERLPIKNQRRNGLRVTALERTRPRHEKPAVFAKEKPRTSGELATCQSRYLSDGKKPRPRFLEFYNAFLR